MPAMVPIARNQGHRTVENRLPHFGPVLARGAPRRSGGALPDRGRGGAGGGPRAADRRVVLLVVCQGARGRGRGGEARTRAGSGVASATLRDGRVTPPPDRGAGAGAGGATVRAGGRDLTRAGSRRRLGGRLPRRGRIVYRRKRGRLVGQVRVFAPGDRRRGLGQAADRPAWARVLSRAGSTGSGGASIRGGVSTGSPVPTGAGAEARSSSRSATCGASAASSLIGGGGSGAGVAQAAGAAPGRASALRASASAAQRYAASPRAAAPAARHYAALPRASPSAGSRCGGW